VTTRAPSTATTPSRRSVVPTIICAFVGAAAIAGCGSSGAKGSNQTSSLTSAPDQSSTNSSTPPGSRSPAPTTPSASAMIHTPPSTDAAVADADLCIQAASRRGLGFPIRETTAPPSTVARAIRAGFIPELTSLPGADGQEYAYCYIASSIAAGTGAAKAAAGALSATYLVYKQGTNVVVRRTTFSPPS
jgi:hypothetical protein